MLHTVTPQITIGIGSATEIKALPSSPERSILCFDVLKPRTTERKDGDCFNPPALHHIARFCLYLQETLRRHPDKVIVVCTRGSEPEYITVVSLLVGGFMILCQGLDVDAVRDSFCGPISNDFVGFCDPGSRYEPRGLLIDDCWRALHRARCEDWINLAQKVQPPGPRSLGSFDIDECSHYSEACNGNVSMVVPGKMIVFQRPVDLPSPNLWESSVASGYRFSPAFYASLFQEAFDVSVVLRLGAVADSNYDRTDFDQADIDVEDLPLGSKSGEPSGLLFALDRVLAVSRAAPGQIALHNCADGPGFTGSLAVGYLTNRLRFDSKVAIAWVRMIKPELLVPLRSLKGGIKLSNKVLRVR